MKSNRRERLTRPQYQFVCGYNEFQSTLIPSSRRPLAVRLMRLRRGETVPALLPHRLASLPLGVGDHLRRPRSALGCSAPHSHADCRTRHCGCADHHGIGADRVFGSDGRTTNSLAQTTNSNVDERTSANVASAIAPRRCFSIASRNGRAPKRG